MTKTIRKLLGKGCTNNGKSHYGFCIFAGVCLRDWRVERGFPRKLRR